MIKVLLTVVVVIALVILTMFGIGAVFLNLFDRLDDERPEEEV